ncbi:hypothetical protein [Dinghuibacter silviterrae]|uniref:Uncharacterized protein n=1 Tax=Dinghuibacter silviterrae TaxID=1539049 RepID=A0A4R8DRL7_9BACT|nr:hypothetical protein [Dinghuibacter silviterrae]TDX00619.1 hypothetical protein EDB95_1644 [Dinghuibacter silviterrae]
MNFDDLKDAWAKEPAEGGSPSLPTEKTTSAVSRIRKNMRNEFIATAFGFALTLVIVLMSGFNHLTFLVVCTASFLFVQTGYYFTRFFLFYRRMERYDLGLKKSIRKIVYELELNMEVYKTYSFCVTPTATLLWIAVMGASSWGKFMRDFICEDTPGSAQKIFWIMVTFLIAQAMVAFVLHLQVRTKYGRHVAELKRVLDDLED